MVLHGESALKVERALRGGPHGEPVFVYRCLSLTRDPCKPVHEKLPIGRCCEYRAPQSEDLIARRPK